MRRLVPLELLLFVAGVVLCVLASCASSAPLKVFTRENGARMYFIKPLRFDAHKGREHVEVDWTIHAVGNEVEKVVMNYSVYSAYPMRRVDSVRLFNDAAEFRWLPGGECFFVEPDNRGFHSRWSTTFPADELRPLLSSDVVRIELHGSQELAGKSTLRTNRTFKALRKQLLPML